MWFEYAGRAVLACAASGDTSDVAEECRRGGELRQRTALPSSGLLENGRRRRRYLINMELPPKARSGHAATGVRVVCLKRGRKSPTLYMRSRALVNQGL